MGKFDVEAAKVRNQLGRISVDGVVGLFRNLRCVPDRSPTMIRHVVQPGECLSCIAADHGMTWQKLWELPENRPLRDKRKDPNILLVGDIVFVPVKDLASVACDSEQLHTFKLVRSGARLRLRFLVQDVPRANAPYRLVIDGIATQGRTNDDGVLFESIPPGALVGTVEFPQGTQGVKSIYEILFGQLDPIDEIAGIQQRLFNLGFDPGPIDGILGPLTKAGVSAFQEANELQVDGIAGPITKAKLVELHGS